MVSLANSLGNPDKPLVDQEDPTSGRDSISFNNYSRLNSKVLESVWLLLPDQQARPIPELYHNSLFLYQSCQRYIDLYIRV
jgi:hypothetical protein